MVTIFQQYSFHPWKFIQHNLYISLQLLYNIIDINYLANSPHFFLWNPSINLYFIQLYRNNPFVVYLIQACSSHGLTSMNYMHFISYSQFHPSELTPSNSHNMFDFIWFDYIHQSLDGNLLIHQCSSYKKQLIVCVLFVTSCMPSSCLFVSY